MPDAAQTPILSSGLRPASADGNTVAREGMTLGPGLLLTVLIALAASALHFIPGIGSFSPMILAIIIGMIFHNLAGPPHRARAGVTFTMRRVLRFAIILLGLQLTAAQIIAVGPGGVT